MFSADSNGAGNYSTGRASRRISPTRIRPLPATSRSRTVRNRAPSLPFNDLGAPLARCARGARMDGAILTPVRVGVRAGSAFADNSGTIKAPPAMLTPTPKSVVRDLSRLSNQHLQPRTFQSKLTCLLCVVILKWFSRLKVLVKAN